MLIALLKTLQGQALSIGHRLNFRRAIRAAESLYELTPVTTAITIGEDHFGNVLAVSGARTLTLPAATLFPGRRFAVTVAVAGTATFAGAALLQGNATITTLLPAGGLMTIESAGAAWRVMSLSA